MKFTDLSAFETHLRTAKERPHLTLLITPDPYDGQVALRALQDCLDLDQMARFDGERMTAEQLGNGLDSGSLFGDRSALLIQSIEKLQKTLLERVESYSVHPAPDLDLILMSSALAPTSPLAKGVAQRGLLLQLPVEKPWVRERQMPAWVQAQGRSLGKELSVETARLLVNRLGTNKFALRGELEKLTCFVGDRSHIGLQDVEKLTAKVAEAQTWELGRAVVRRDLPKAIELIGRLLNQGAPMVLLMAYLRNQFQTGLLICTIRESGGGAAEVAAQLPQLQGKRLEMAIEEALRCGALRYRKGLLALFEGENLLRVKGLEERIVLERLVAKVAA